jgi:hypothetical protein
MLSNLILILRNARRARLEGRKAVMRRPRLNSCPASVLIRPTDLMANARRSPPLSASGRGRRYSSAAATGVEFISGLCYTSKLYCVSNKPIPSASGAKCQPEVFLLAPSGPVIRSLLGECSFGCLRL